ncbi:hypothetical protein COB87_002010 [Candidatus Wolfebacteria bacterium]|nr:hypothetical protein [Candidatus Wolfebacteria bacterium]
MRKLYRHPLWVAVSVVYMLAFAAMVYNVTGKIEQALGTFVVIGIVIILCVAVCNTLRRKMLK